MVSGQFWIFVLDVLALRILDREGISEIFDFLVEDFHTVLRKPIVGLIIGGYPTRPGRVKV